MNTNRELSTGWLAEETNSLEGDERRIQPKAPDGLYIRTFLVF